MRGFAKNRHFHFEALEIRSMMTSDFEAALHLETLDVNGDPVSHVEVGDTFLLRLTVETFAETPDDRRVMNTADLTFDPRLVEAKNVVDGILVPGNAARSGRWMAAPGRWERIHWFGRPNSLRIDNPSLEPQWQLPLVAKAGGEVVFETNPSDIIDSSPDTIDERRVKHGLVRLQIGNAATFPASPLRNLGDPSDIDNNGEINRTDLQVIEDALGSQARIVLAGSTIVQKQSPYLDATGDGVVDAADMDLVKDQFFPERIVIPPSPYAFLQDADFQISLRAINLRTGLAVGADALEGDLLEVAFVGKGDSDGSIFQNLATLKKHSNFELLGTFPDHYLLRLTKPGTVVIEHALTTNSLMIRNIAAMLGYGAEGPELISNRISELLAGTKQSIQVSANTNRPAAADDSYSYQQFSEKPTAREIAGALSQQPLVLKIDQGKGVLVNDQAHPDARAVLVAQPENGRVTLNADGSFEFTPYRPYFDTVRLGSSFSYVLITPEGTSEIRTVTINGKTLPLMDMRIRVVDQQGQEVTSASVGQSLTLEVVTFANSLWKTFDSAPVNSRFIHPLSFRYGIDESIARYDGEPTDFDFFWHDIGELVFENGVYSIKLTPTLFHPSFQRDGDSFIADFKHNYSLGDHPNIDNVIFRQRITVNKAGSLGLSLDSPYIKLWDGHTQFPGAINVEVAELTVSQSPFQNAQMPSDVDQNGITTPRDALLIINSLNQFGSRKLTFSNGEGEKSVQMFVDVNGDGNISPMDALRVINTLNRQRNKTATGEGEEDNYASVFQSSIETNNAVDIIAEDIASYRRRKALGQ